MTIFLAGGGSGGSTAPLLAVAEELVKRRPKLKLFFIGSKRGPEISLLSSEKIDITRLTIPAGKWRRYFSVMNLLDLFKVAAGFLKALFLINKHKPDLVFGAGSFVQVPVAWAAFLLKVPVVVHQQDLSPLLSTKLAAPIAKRITVAFAASARSFPQSSGLFRKVNQNKKVVWVGNPVRQSLLRGSAEKAARAFRLNEKYPTILVMGGGQGADAINRALAASLPELVKYVQIIHLTGKGNAQGGFRHEHYHPFEFLSDNLGHAYAAADLVVGRAGMSSIGEISALGKASILIPLPGSPQEQNAALLAYLRCAVPLTEDVLSPKILVQFIRKILWNEEVQKTMHENVKKLLPRGADKKLADVILKVISGNERG